MRKKIGEFLVHKGVLTPAEVDTILAHSRKHGMRFGDAGLALGLLTTQQMIDAFGPHFRVDFFHVHPEYFPAATRDLISADELLRLGALPLGYKTKSRFFRATKRLNLGLLNPDRKDAIAEVEKIAKEKIGSARFSGSKVFLILPEHFLSVLEHVYGISETSIAGKAESHVDGTLKLFLEAEDT